MTGRRYNCGCGKKRYRDEQSAMAAASADEQAFGERVTVYRCVGGLAWHVTAHGFVPEALRSIGRRLAYELVEHGHVDLAGLDSRQRQRLERMALLGLVQQEQGRAVTVDRPGLERVVRVGLDAYAQERERT